MDIQAMLDGMSELARSTRSQYHVTLGGLITMLQSLEPSAKVWLDDGSAPGQLMSYRGYYADLAFSRTYADLAFSRTSEAITVDQMLTTCQAALGQSFEGYKGGDYVMGEDTPLWMANWGMTGLAIVAMQPTPEGALLLVTKRVAV